MILSLQQLANDAPAMRRYVKHGFELRHPLLGDEQWFEIVSPNQTLRVNRTNSEVRAVS